MPAFQPQAFGKYFLVDKIAMGGMAEIFLAKSQRDESRGYLVIKRILPHFTGNAQFIDMFIDEAKISSLLSHTNIVPLYDLGKVGDSYFLAMEYVPGQDLKGVVKRCNDRGVRLSYEHAAYVMREVCLGLDYAHTKHDGAGKPLAIVHRDISPQNVLVGYDGQVKITDFGIAKASSKLDSTQVGTLKGKFGYMAPEQVVAGMDLDHRSDVFASGVILWELITGQRLFAGRNEIEILERVRAAKIDPPSTLDAEVPRELERIIFKALMKDRDKRYQWSKEMANDLTKFLAQVSPRFGASDMSSVMKELFSTEIDSIKQKFNVVIGPPPDRAHVERGAALESTYPDHREEAPRPAPRGAPPPDARVAAATTVQPSPAAATVVQPPPPPPGAPRRPMATTSSADESRTLVAPPPAPPRNPADQTRMTPSGRFVMPDIDPPAPPTQRPLPEADRTSALDLLAEVDAEAAEAGIRREKTDERRVEPRERRNTLEVDHDFAPAESSSTTKNDPRRDRRAERRGPSVAVRLLSWIGFLAVAASLGVASLLYTGAIANPFAAPVVEVFTNVETAAVSIDGNVVLASGRSGRWPVGTGQRVVEVTARGYEPFTQVLDLDNGDVTTIDALLVPSADAVGEVTVTSVPAGATAWLGDELLGNTPVTIKKPLGEYVVRITHDRYDDSAVTVSLTRPGATAGGLDVTLVPNIASIAVNTIPEGADVSVDGTPRGKAPVTVDGLEPGKPVVVQVVKKGFRTESRTVTPEGGTGAFAVDVELVSTTAPVAPTPMPTATPASVGNPVASPTPAAALKTMGPNMGLLSVEVAGGWGEVYLDGARLTSRTPLEGAEIAAGQHQLRVVNPMTGSERTMTVLITAGKETRQRLSLD